MADLKYSVYEILEEAAENTEEIIVYDSTTVDWTKFDWTNGFYPHKLTKTDIYKPYGISWQYYQSVIYEDIILLLNGIEDIWEVPVGTKIRVPKLIDLKTFMRENKI